MNKENNWDKKWNKNLKKFDNKNLRKVKDLNLEDLGKWEEYLKDQDPKEEEEEKNPPKEDLELLEQNMDLKWTSINLKMNITLKKKDSKELKDQRG